MDDIFGSLIEKMRNQEEIDYKVEGIVLGSSNKLILGNYFKTIQGTAHLYDSEVDKIIQEITVFIDETLEKTHLLNGNINLSELSNKNLQVESDILQLIQLKYKLLLQMQRILSGRQCYGSYITFYPIVTPLKSYVKVGEPVEIIIGFLAEETILSSQGVIIKVNGEKIDIHESYLLTKSAKKGKHWEKIRVEIINPITGMKRNRDFEWFYVAE